MPDSTPPIGKVYLVGAGPGAAGLITVRGVECLQRADVVLFDFLVNPVLTQHAPDTAELICVGKHGGGARIWKQDEINRELVRFAKAGKTVVRLKGGDPAVFARGGEEVAFLAEHKVHVEIVPGITTALAAGSHAGISITHRDLASAVALVTGRERPGKAESDLDYAALARFPGTLVFYMGVTTVAQWTGGLLSKGMPADTPVALVRRCSHADQQTIRCRLDEVESRLTPRTKFPPPVIAIVGAVAAQPNLANWFEDRPLFGKTVVVTRPAHQAAGLGGLLAEQGARVIYQPVIAIEPILTAADDYAHVAAALDQLESYDWIVFSSTNGVEHFFARLGESGKDVRCLANAKIASVGSATTAVLQRFCIQPDLQPQKFDADFLASDLGAKIESGTRILLVRASRGRDVLRESLTAAGAHVDDVPFYRSADIRELSDEFASSVSSGEIDWVTVTSSAIARSLVKLVGTDTLGKVKLASISPITTATLRELGLEPAVEADPYTMPALAEAIAAE